MYDTTISLTSLLGAVFLCIAPLLTSWYLRLRKRQPGPYGLPVVGYYPFLKPAAYKDFVELGKQYGDVFPINILGNDYYILNTLDAIKQCLNQETANYRPEEYYFFNEIYDKKSIAAMNGDEWKVHRKFLVHNVMNTPTLLEVETRLVSITDQFLAYLKSTQGKPVDIHKGISCSIMNLIGSILHSEKFEWDDRRLMDLKYGVFEPLHILKGIELALAGPVYQFMMRIVHRHRSNKIKQASDKAIKVMSEIVKKRLSDGHGKNNDILDKLLRNHFDEELVVPKEQRLYTLEHLKYTLYNMTVAGTTTSTDTFYRIMQLLASHPVVQDKLHHEICDVIGTNEVNFSHRLLLPYTQAVIEEAIRFSCLAPMAITRQAQEDILVGGVTIPKGDYIIPNLYASMNNADVFPEPETFKPERFIDEHGQFVRHEANCQFTFGKRSCPGMMYAKKDLFYLLVSTIRQFEIKLPGQKPKNAINLGSFQIVKEFELCAISRY
ncbi:Cytochrome P450 2E1 [Halotydeus destructor]|nr:Cytochrome P450 2E1 [Halotydeus destructor]